MKKFVAIILAVVMITSMFAGCGSAAEEPAADAPVADAPVADAPIEETPAVEPAEGEKIIADLSGLDTDMSVLKGKRIGLAQRITTIPWQIAQMDSLTAAAEKYGVEFIYTDADNDQSKQISDVEDLCAQGIDALLYPPVEYEAGAAGLEIAAEYGVPVFLMGQDCRKTDDQYIAQALSDYEMDGGVAGKWIVDNMESAKIVEIQGQLGTNTAIDRGRGFGNAIAAGGPNYEIVVQQSGNFMMDDAQQAMENIIQSYKGQFDTVFCHNDDMALGALAALKANGIEGITVVAVDGQKAAVQEIINGNMHAIATCETRIGELMFSMIAAYMNGEEQPKVVSIPSEIIDINNAADALTNGMAF